MRACRLLVTVDVSVLLEVQTSQEERCLTSTKMEISLANKVGHRVGREN